ncbi:MAG: pyruvate dehydrogenase (acetyl-transferring) E1 component subunit alpha [Candidatus Zixiibacteriota bacterium]
MATPKQAQDIAMKDFMFKDFDPLQGKRLEIMNINGEIVTQKWMPKISDAKIVEAYKTMLYARIGDLKAVSYQRQGRLYTLPTNIGQEAAAVGSAMAIEKNDWMVPAYRELGAWLVKGATMRHYFYYFGGSEEGSRFPEGTRLLPVSVPISSQLTHAAGIGHSINYKGEKDVVITYFGDGGSSQGDFHEGLNWAAVFNCPVIFFCNNNGYAISLPRKRQTKARTIAQKAIAYEIPGIQIDGNDFFAVYRATSEAARYAREGHGPVLIEAVTYRRGAHTTSDDPTKYRSAEEEKEWEQKDPLLRLRKYLESKNLWDEKNEQDHTEESTADIESQFKEYEQFEGTPLEDIFKYQLEEMPDSLKSQMVDMRNFINRKEG